jgi:polysaccharide biosynthesis transport protein
MNNLSRLQPEEMPEDTTFDIRAMIDGLAHRWLMIVTIALCFFLVTFAGLMTTSPAYEASVQVLIFDPQWQTEAPSDERRASGENFDTVAINTEIEVLRSAALSLRVARELRLDEHREFQLHSRVEELLEHHHFGIGYDTLTPRTEVALESAKVKDKRVEIAAAILRQRVHVNRVPSSYVLVVSITSESPQLAQLLVATVVDDYFADQRETRQKALQKMALWLQERLFDLKARVVDTETAMEKLKAQSGLSDTEKGSVNEQQITDLNAQLMLARAEVAEKRARLVQARQPSKGVDAPLSLSEALISPLMGQLRLQQSEMRRREAQLRAKLGNGHAEVLAIDTQLAGIDKAINDEAEQGVADLQSTLDIADRREQSLETSLGQLTAKRGNSGDYVKLQQLRRVADADSKLYETYLSEYNEIGSRASFQVVGARIISPAELPTDPIFPRHKPLICLGAGSLGLVIGMLLALLADYFQPRVRTGAQAERMFGYPVLGGVPLVSQQKSSSARADDQLLQTIVDAPLSTFSEVIRAIRISLGLPDQHHDPVVVLVTSCLPGEGKSTIAMLLAASSAASHKKTMLVDCDLRGRAVSQRVGKQMPGLAELLSGTADLESVTVRDALTGCFVIPAGERSDNPGDLLSSKQMREMLVQLRSEFDYIVLDTPPLLSVVDTLTLLPIADKILLAVDSNQARYDVLTEAFGLLRSEPDRLAGMVFNKLSHKQLTHYRYGAYYNGV